MTTTLDAMRAAVIAGRMMRARQKHCERMGPKSQSGRTERIDAEAEFERLSLTAVMMEQQEKERGE